MNVTYFRMTDSGCQQDSQRHGVAPPEGSPSLDGGCRGWTHCHVRQEGRRAEEHHRALLPGHDLPVRRPRAGHRVRLLAADHPPVAEGGHARRPDRRREERDVPEEGRRLLRHREPRPRRAPEDPHEPLLHRGGHREARRRHRDARHQRHHRRALPERRGGELHPALHQVPRRDPRGLEGHEAPPPGGRPDPGGDGEGHGRRCAPRPRAAP